VEGQPDPEPNRVLDAGIQTTSPEYFRVMRIPLKRGRFFDDRDRGETEAVTVVNEALVTKYFPKDDPIGRHIRQFEGPETKNPWLRIVGVVATERGTHVTAEMTWADTPVIYRPWAQNTQPSAVLVLRTFGGRAPLVNLIQRASGDPDVSIGGLESVPHALAKVLAYPRFRAVLLAGFAGIALLLAVVGLYGVLSRLVTQRTHEIGIRMALGARRKDVLTMVAKQGMLLTTIGIAFGLVSAWGLTRLLTALLYGVSATDPATLGLVTAALLASAGLATFLPARRATSGSDDRAARRVNRC
jgi:putative ABC transport system permease protein